MTTPQISRPTISAVINTRNASRHLDGVLASLAPWVDQIVVCDMESSDSTLDIARRHDVTIVQIPALGFPEAGIPAALEAATSEWIIRVDADEVVPRALAEHLVALASSNGFDVVYVPIRTWMLGAALNHGSFGPENSCHPRFFRKGFVTHQIKIHGQHRPVEEARVVSLVEEPGWRTKGLHLEHFSYLGVTDLVSRLVRYSGNESDQTAEEMVGRRFWWSLRRMPVELLGRMVVHRAWRDGRTAMMMAANSAIYQAVRAMHLAQRRWFSSDADILRTYDKRIAEILDPWSR